MADGAKIFNYGIPYISGRAKTRDFKFGACIDCEKQFSKHAKKYFKGTFVTGNSLDITNSSF